jgi:hypothetical protein
MSFILKNHLVITQNYIVAPLIVMWKKWFLIFPIERELEKMEWWRDVIAIEAFRNAIVSQISSFMNVPFFTLHSLDPKLVKMTVGCGISHTNTKTHTRYNWSIPKVHPHTHINQYWLIILAIYTCGMVPLTATWDIHPTGEI